MEMSTSKLPLRLYVIYLVLLCVCGLFHWNPVVFQQDWQTQFDIEKALGLTDHTVLESHKVVKKWCLENLVHHHYSQ